MINKNLKELELNRAYGGFGVNLINDFYRPLLSSSNLYRRSTAFFTGGIYAIAASSIKEFILENDGKINLVTSTIVNKNYIHIEDQNENIKNLETSLDNLTKFSDSKTIIEVVASLLFNNKLEIRIADVPSPGIHHEKVGIFTDFQGNSLSFSGSVNETWSGWTANSEEFKVFRSWDDSSEYFDYDVKNFDDLWNNTKKNVKVYTLPEALNEKILSFTDDYSIESLERNIDLIQNFSSKVIVNGFEDDSELKLLDSNENKQKKLMEHQSSVLKDWADNNYFGIIKHATGSGKTITGINGIREWLKIHNIAIVLVPSVLLLEQWIEELENELDDVNLIKTGGGEPKKNWSSTLRFLTSNNNTEKTVVISTIGTALTDDFKSSVMWGKHLMLLIDEVHNIGSPKAKTFLDINVGAALGLSATPERYGDTEGTDEIYKFFIKILKPEFTILDAINCGRLVPYIHEPFEVKLTPSEEDEYKELSLKISKIYSMLEKGEKNSDLQSQLELLLFKRSKIIKKAENKIPAAVEIVSNNFKDGDYWLVYCQDKDHLKLARESFHNAGIKTLEYMSAMSGDRTATLDYFRTNGGVLIAIKCLDEGIDIPYLQNAIILSSSQNPREHIQRRGRVLRKSENKNLATIYDSLVLTTNDLNSSYSQVMLTEIKRAYNFSKDAYNKEAEIKIITLAQKYNININQLRESLVSDIILEEE
ncbi:MAG: DEAD/DEAH box helicase [Flavobacteriaceae bacterium TMED238]|nr:MAG: DEAD/DEAH box helicase [Flavobacteriaceae bacterium TMED238]